MVEQKSFPGGFLNPSRPPFALECVPTLCRGSEHREYPPIARWKGVYLNSDPTTKEEFKCEGCYHRLFQLPYTERWDSHVFTHCAHNEYDSLRHRYLRETRPIIANAVDWALLDRCIEELVGLLAKTYDPDYSVEQVFEKMDGRMTNRYRSAYNDLYDYRGNLDGIAKVNMFIKTEDILSADPEFSKSARMIMGRDPRFTLVYAMFIDPIEEAMKGVPQYASGRDMFGMGELFFERVYGQWMAKTDYSKFESSKRVDWIWNVEVEVCTRLMRRCGVSESQIEDFCAMVMRKMVTNAYSMHGVKVRFNGCQISGDRDTKLFNSITNWILARFFRHWHGLDPDQFIVMGDDGGHQLPAGVYNYYDTSAIWGFEIDFKVVEHYSDFEFCSSKFIQYKPGKFVMVQNLNKVLSKVGITLRGDLVGYLDDYYASLGYMYQIVYAGVPVYQELGDWLRGSVKGRHFVNLSLFSSGGSRGLLDAFKAQHTPHEVDKSLVMSELAMCFDFTYADYGKLLDYFKHPLRVPAVNCGRRKTTSVRVQLCAELVDPRDLVVFTTNANPWVADSLDPPEPPDETPGLVGTGPE